MLVLAVMVHMLMCAPMPPHPLLPQPFDAAEHVRRISVIEGGIIGEGRVTGAVEVFAAHGTLERPHIFVVGIKQVVTAYFKEASTSHRARIATVPLDLAAEGSARKIGVRHIRS
jgi:hypothetical protein